MIKRAFNRFMDGFEKVFPPMFIGWLIFLILYCFWVVIEKQIQ